MGRFRADSKWQQQVVCWMSNYKQSTRHWVYHFSILESTSNKNWDWDNSLVFLYLHKQPTPPPTNRSLLQIDLWICQQVSGKQLWKKKYTCFIYHVFCFCQILPCHQKCPTFVAVFFGGGISATIPEISHPQPGGNKISLIVQPSMQPTAFPMPGDTTWSRKNFLVEILSWTSFWRDYDWYLNHNLWNFKIYTCDIYIYYAIYIYANICIYIHIYKYVFLYY